MTDEVTYKLPFGFIGRLVNTLMVKGRLKKIFDYRQKILDDRFNRE